VIGEEIGAPAGDSDRLALQDAQRYPLRTLLINSRSPYHFFLSVFTGLQILFFLLDVARHFLQAYLPGTSHSFGLSSKQPKVLSST
jgi:hypothetical protein